MSTNEIHAQGGEIIIYQTPDGQTDINVQMKDETIWLDRHQMAILFDRDVKTIGKHIANALGGGGGGGGGRTKTPPPPPCQRAQILGKHNLWNARITILMLLSLSDTASNQSEE